MVEIADWLRETCHVLARCWRDAGGTPTRCQWARVIGVAVAFRIHLSCSRVNIPQLAGPAPGVDHSTLVDGHLMEGLIRGCRAESRAPQFPQPCQRSFKVDPGYLRLGLWAKWRTEMSDALSGHRSTSTEPENRVNMRCNDASKGVPGLVIIRESSNAA